MAAVYGNARSFTDQDEEVVDSQNRYLTENLSHKVNRLKSLAFDIETETKEHNNLLDGIGSDFESSTGLLLGSMNRIHKVMNSGRGNRKAMVYMAGIIIGIFLILYFAFSSSKSPS